MIIDGTNGLTFNNATTQNSGGQVLQVISQTSSTSVTSSGGTIATLLSFSITPKFATSKILVMSSVPVYITPNTNQVAFSGIYKGTTSGTLLQDMYSGFGTVLTSNPYFAMSHQYLDSPATTSSTTYTLAINRASSATTSVSNGGPYTLTLMEIAG
jgi:hypothetical protein